MNREPWAHGLLWFEPYGSIFLMSLDPNIISFGWDYLSLVLVCVG